MRPREGIDGQAADPRFREVRSTSALGADAPRGTACAVGIAREQILAQSSIEDTFICVHGRKHAVDILRVAIVNLLVR